MNVNDLDLSLLTAIDLTGLDLNNDANDLECVVCENVLFAGSQTGAKTLPNSKVVCLDCQKEATADDDDEDDVFHRPSRRRLSRHERLQGLADSGCDTWAEYRSER